MRAFPTGLARVAKHAATRQVWLVWLSTLLHSLYITTGFFLIQHVYPYVLESPVHGIWYEFCSFDFTAFANRHAKGLRR